MKLRQKKKILFLLWNLSCAAAPSSITLSQESAWLDLSSSSPNRFRIKGHFFFLYQTERHFFSPPPLISGESKCSPHPKNTRVFCSVNCPLLPRLWGVSDPFHFLPVAQYGFWSIGILLGCVVVFCCWYVEQMF